MTRKDWLIGLSGKFFTGQVWEQVKFKHTKTGKLLPASGKIKVRLDGRKDDSSWYITWVNPKVKKPHPEQNMNESSMDGVKWIRVSC